ncbi:MAG: hypothetical protein K6C13_06235 [Oscillospiraceae bacterium]|nr:hypothetical protein [Oscillospiraceae bacterium]
MKVNIKEYIVRLVILFIGLVIAHLGVTLFLLSDLGADPFNVLIQGLHSLTVKAASGGITHGMVHMAVCFLIIIALIITDKSYIKAGTVVCMFCGGPIIDFFSWLLAVFHIGEMTIVFKLLILIIGCAVLAFGMTIVIRSEAGTGPNDLVAVVISDKSKKRFGIVRIVTDCVFVAAGALLGGKFGVGTLICAFLVGPVADLCMPVSSSIVEKGLKLMKISPAAAEKTDK